MSRLEHIEGARWARETCEKFGLMKLSQLPDSNLVDMLKRGKTNKPASYANGVQEIIDMVERAQA